MGDWYQVEKSRLWSLPLSRYYFFQNKTQMFQIFGNLDIEKIDKYQVCVMSFFGTENGEEQFKTTLYIQAGVLSK